MAKKAVAKQKESGPQQAQPAAPPQGGSAAEKRTAAKGEPAERPSKKKAPRKKRAPAASDAGAAKPRKATGAQAVRDYLKQHPDAKNKEIVLALSKQGIVIDEYLPASIRSRAKHAGEKKPPLKKPPQLAPGQPPTVFIQAPLYEHFVRDLKRAKTHTQVLKNIRILIARLNRIDAIVDALKHDDWEISVLPEHDGLMFSARHRMATNEPQARARIEKLGIKPNEIEIGLAPSEGAS